MDRETARAAAGELYRARVEHRTIASLPDGMVPTTTDDGYAVAAAWTDHADWEVVGWKIGCTSRAAQEMLSVAHPIGGRVFGPFVHRSPAALEGSDFTAPLVEGEFAFTLGADLPARERPYERAEVEAAIASVHPAIEIVDTRFANFITAGAPNLIADCGANGALILGPPTTEWRGIDLAAAPVTMHIDGEVVGAGTGADVYGHPLDALTWLVGILSNAGAGVGLRAGQVVTTGTCTGAVPLPAGSTAVTDHGPLGSAEVTLRAV
jgi:2-keto-4-pentenoate hydratase